MSFGDFLELKLLDHVFSAVTYTPPGTLYVGMSTTTPLDDGTNVTEPVGMAYQRVAVVNNAVNWPAAVAGLKSNGTTVTFPEALGAWGLMTDIVVYDSLAGGNFLGTGPISVPKQVDSGDVAQFPIGTIQITLA